MNKLCMKTRQNVNNQVRVAIRRILSTCLHTASTAFTGRRIRASRYRHKFFFAYPQLPVTLLTIIKVRKWF